MPLLFVIMYHVHVTTCHALIQRGVNIFVSNACKSLETKSPIHWSESQRTKFMVFREKKLHFYNKEMKIPTCGSQCEGIELGLLAVWSIILKKKKKQKKEEEERISK